MSGRHLQRQFIDFIRGLFAPGVCLACASALPDTGSLCTDCQQLLQRIPNPCQSCAESNPAQGSICPRCLLNPPRWQKMIAPYHYNDLVRDYLLQLKYNEALHLANSLCGYSRDSFNSDFPMPEVLLPVPLHRQRLFERGFNQAEEIAHCWSSRLGIKVDRKSLTRTRQTDSQSGLNAKQRRRNLHNAFAYAPQQPYLHVAIVDDIITTGSTVEEITQLLHQQGVEYVEVWALARASR